MLKNKHETGFTIVELLIVIVVIGILAAITIVAYNGIQNRAHDTSIQSDLNNLAKKIELYKVTRDAYPSTVQINDVGFKASTGSYAVAPETTYNLVYCINTTTGQAYAVTARSKSGNLYYIAHNSGGVKTLPSWGTNAGESCGNTGVTGTNNWRGYASEASPQWRTWTQG